MFDHVVRYRAAHKKEQLLQNQLDGGGLKQITVSESKDLMRSLRAAGYKKPLTQSDLQK